MATETTTTTPSESDRLDKLAGEAIKAASDARYELREMQDAAEEALRIVDATLNADQLRAGIVLGIREAARYARAHTGFSMECNTGSPIGDLVVAAWAAIEAVEAPFIAALDTILAAAKSIVGPRDESQQCNAPLDALREMRDRLAKVVASFKPAPPNRIGTGDDLPF